MCELEDGEAGDDAFESPFVKDCSTLLGGVRGAFLGDNDLLVGVSFWVVEISGSTSSPVASGG